MDIDKEVLKGYIDIVLLSLLYPQESLYGYELVKRTREKSDGTFEIKEATLYLALKRMEKNGLAESHWNDSDRSGGGRRKYYRLTDEGCTRLRNKKLEWEYLKNTMEKFLGGVEL